MQYDLDGAQEKITQFGCRERRLQKGTNPILSRLRRPKAGSDRIPDQLVESLLYHLHNYLRAAFAAYEMPTTTHHGQPGGSVYAAITNIIDGLAALIEDVEGLRGPSAKVH